MKHKTRPSWTHVYQNYPKTSIQQDMPSPDVFKRLFGSQYNTATQMLAINTIKSGRRITQQVLPNNACATRISVALTLSGHDIKSVSGIPIDFTADTKEANFQSVTHPSINMKGKGIIQLPVR